MWSVHGPAPKPLGLFGSGVCSSKHMAWLFFGLASPAPEVTQAQGGLGDPPTPGEVGPALHLGRCQRP